MTLKFDPWCVLTRGAVDQCRFLTSGEHEVPALRAIACLSIPDAKPVQTSPHGRGTGRATGQDRLRP